MILSLSVSVWAQSGAVNVVYLSISVLLLRDHGVVLFEFTHMLND